MPNSPESFQEKLDTVIKAWETKAPAASFGGMTLAQFQALVKPSSDARQKIADGEQMIKDRTNERSTADGISNPLLLKVVNGVKGDTNYGEDSNLYEEMGYVRKSEHKTGLTRKKKAKPTT